MQNSNHAENLRKLESAVREWAEREAPIRAVVAVGSLARTHDHPADEHSDLDLIIFAQDSTPYTSDSAWIHGFGKVGVHIFEPTGGNDPEYLIVYDMGSDLPCKADFVFWAWSDLTDMLENNHLHPILERGYYSLVDKDGLIAKLPKPTGKVEAKSPPTQAQFDAEVRHFWYATYQGTRYLARRDLWLVQYSLIRMRENLLTLLEWYARSLNGWDHDTWHMGRFMGEWLDPPTYAALDFVFGGFDSDSSWRTLVACMTLFRHVAKVCVECLNFTYPADVDAFVSDYVRTLYDSE